MRQRILIDTGPLVAIFSRQDYYHESCIRELQNLPVPLLTCWPVVTEAAWLLRNYPHVIQKMVGSTGTLFDLAPLGNESAGWISNFMKDYHDIHPQIADACLVYLAEKENIDTVITLDRRDFSIYRFGTNRHFHLLPE